MTDQLRECPFCGSSNVVVRGMDKVYSDRGWVRYKRGGWFVMCDGCKFSHGSRFVFDAEGSIPCHAHNSADEAIAAWNTRPTAVASHAEGEAFGRGYVKGYQAGLGAAAEECRRMGHALDSGGNEYVRYGDAIKCAAAIGGLRAPELNEPSGNSGELEKMNEPFGNSEEFTHPPRSGDEARDAARLQWLWEQLRESDKHWHAPNYDDDNMRDAIDAAMAEAAEGEKETGL